MRSILEDVRYALRQLRKSPGFAATAIVVLALGIGANIAVFTLLSEVLLRPLPYAHPDRVVTLELSGSHRYFALSLANALQLQDALKSKMQMGMAVDRSMASVVGPGGRVQVEHSLVTADLFSLLGVQPALGRLFRQGEDLPGHNRVVVLGNQLWRNLYGEDPHIVGKTLAVKGQLYTIVGVMPKAFSFPYNDASQIWSPAALTAVGRSSMNGDRSEWVDKVFARLPDGMTAAQASDLLTRQEAILGKQNPDADLPGTIAATPYRESLNREARKPLLLLYATVAGIWLLACLNVTSLMLVRAVSRAREQAVRAALGASRSRLLQQTIVESLLLSLLGAAAGMLLAQCVLQLLWRRIKLHLPLAAAVHVDWRVLGCLLALTLATAIVAGVFPALRAMRSDVRESLHGVSATASARQNRTRDTLVVAQIAITLVFLVGAGLFLRTIHALRQVPLGFSQQNVLTGGIIVNLGSHQAEDVPEAAGDVVRDSYLPLLDKLRAIPGVKVAALSSVLPLRAEFAVSLNAGLDDKHFPRGQEPQADGRLASPGLVEALGIPVLRGRFFTEDDTAASPVVVVVNKAYADRYLPGEDPVGHTVRMADDGRFAQMRIVGEIGDLKQKSVAKATAPELYFSLAQMGSGSPLYGIASAFIQVAIRGAVPADSLRAEFDKALHDVAPYATTTDVKTIREAVEDSFGSQTLTTYLLEGFAGLALLIASIGLYGLLAFTVAQRTREIGVRIALGAPQTSILALVLRRALLLVAAGLVIGAALAWFASKLASSYIFGVRTHDASTFATMLAVLVVASLVAAWLPARRAAAVDPILALRSE